MAYNDMTHNYVRVIYYLLTTQKLSRGQVKSCITETFLSRLNARLTMTVIGLQQRKLDDEFIMWIIENTAVDSDDILQLMSLLHSRLNNKLIEYFIEREPWETEQNFISFVREIGNKMTEDLLIKILNLLGVEDARAYVPTLDPSLLTDKVIAYIKKYYGGMVKI